MNLLLEYQVNNHDREHDNDNARKQSSPIPRILLGLSQVGNANGQRLNILRLCQDKSKWIFIPQPDRIKNRDNQNSWLGEGYWASCVASRTAARAPALAAAEAAVSAPARSGFVELRPAIRAESGVAVVCGKNIRVEVAAGFDAKVLRAVVAAFGAS